MSESLAEALPREQARVRELIQDYLSVGPAGKPAALMMEADLREADVAASSGEVVAMLRVFKKLEGWKG